MNWCCLINYFQGTQRDVPLNRDSMEGGVQGTALLIIFKEPKGATSRFVNLEKFIPFQFSPSFTILVPFWFILQILVFFYLNKVQFWSSSHVEGYFARHRKRRIS